MVPKDETYALLMSSQVGSSDKGLLAIVDKANVRSRSVGVVGLQVRVIIPDPREVFPTLGAVEIGLAGLGQMALLADPVDPRGVCRTRMKRTSQSNRRKFVLRSLHRRWPTQAVFLEIVLVHESIFHSLHAMAILGAKDVLNEERRRRGRSRMILHGQ